MEIFLLNGNLKAMIHTVTAFDLDIFRNPIPRLYGNDFYICNIELRKIWRDEYENNVVGISITTPIALCNCMPIIRVNFQ